MYKLGERVSNYCLTPKEQFFRDIMARTSFKPCDDNDVRLVLDQHAQLDIYSTSSLKKNYLWVDM